MYLYPEVLVPLPGKSGKIGNHEGKQRNFLQIEYRFSAIVAKIIFTRGFLVLTRTIAGAG